jgi:hypothetical protein
MSVECAEGSDHIPTRGWITVVDGNLEATFCSPTCFDAWFSEEVEHDAESSVAENEIHITAPGYPELLGSLAHRVHASPRT